MSLFAFSLAFKEEVHNHHLLHTQIFRAFETYKALKPSLQCYFLRILSVYGIPFACIVEQPLNRKCLWLQRAAET